jgi:beta-glucosidase-like glycosyl hydrolase
VITDDLRMSGAADWAGSLSEAVLAALRAGNDMVMMSSIPPEEAWAKALAEYKSDPAFRARCREAAVRVLAAKLSKLRGKGAVTLSPDYASLEGRLPDPEARTHSLTVSAHAVTFIKQGPLPLQSDGAGYLIAGQYSAFIAEGLKAYPRAKTYRYATSGGKESRAAEAKELVRLAKSASVVILSVGNDGTVPFLEALRDAKPKVVAVSFFSPAALGPSPRADAIVACYSSSAEAFNAAFAAIKGAIPARGMLPIRIP